jgi:Recombination endonuclease VII
VREPRVAPSAQKWCPDCQAFRPIDSFCKNKASRDGLAAYCKPCHNKRGRENKIKNWGSTREYHLRGRYGIGQVEVDAMLEAQGGLCAVCRKADPEHVDHDHQTGKVRGMLCFNCNQALGNVRDSVPVLRALITYLIYSAGGETATKARVQIVRWENVPAVELGPDFHGHARAA